MGGSPAICTSICTPLDAGTIEAAIGRLTRALAAADDATIPALVDERASLRAELRALHAGDAVVRLDDERARRGPRR